MSSSIAQNLAAGIPWKRSGVGSTVISRAPILPTASSGSASGTRRKWYQSSVPPLYSEASRTSSPSGAGADTLKRYSSGAGVHEGAVFGTRAKSGTRRAQAFTALAARVFSVAATPILTSSASTAAG